jgi:serpin B
LTSAEKELVGSSNTFGFKFFKEIVEQEADGNIFVSPLSVSMALGMTLNGANGETRDSMAEALEFSGMSMEEINDSYRSLIDLLGSLDEKVRFQIANSIWPRLGFPVEEEFIDVNESHFDAEVRELDFDDPESVDIINGWVNSNTNGKIEEILTDIPPEIVMLLINAIYFKGDWTAKFDPDNTHDAPFYLSDGTTTGCKMMEQENTVRFFATEDFSAIELPYGDGDFSMVILLPNQGVELDAVIGSFSDENWNAWIASSYEADLMLKIPKFEMKYEINLNDVLKALGMSIAFDRYLADFTGINRDGNLYIDFVKHKTYVRVDEEGTEAAAVTVVGIGVTGGPPTTFIVNRPFAFVIRESHSGTLLFMGKIVKPVF